MDDNAIHQCHCPDCLSDADPHQRLLHGQLNMLLQRLDEQERRWVAGLESKKIGYGGDIAVSRITGLHVDTIRRGREELDAGLADRPTDRVRQPGAGRPPVKKKIRPSSRL
jgi:hypothetical protein